MSSQDSLSKKTSTFAEEVVSPETESVSDEPTLPEVDVLERAKALRSKIQESFGKAAMAMMVLPRYRSQTLADLDHMLFNPLIRNRIAFAYTAAKPSDLPQEDGQSQTLPMDDMAGLAIWASVSPEVDVKIREQIAAGVFPVKLKAEDWTSGEVNWLLDVIAPSKERTAQVVRNLKQVIKGGDLNIHPLVAKLVDVEALEAMGAKRQSAKQVEAPQTEQPGTAALAEERHIDASADSLVKH